jgi:hypothetical protein
LRQLWHGHLGRVLRGLEARATRATRLGIAEGEAGRNRLTNYDFLKRGEELMKRLIAICSVMKKIGILIFVVVLLQLT